MDVTYLYHVRNEDIRRLVNLTSIEDVLTSIRFRLFEYVMRRVSEFATRQVIDIPLPGRRSRGMPNVTWQRQVAKDMAERCLNEEDTATRN